MTSKMTSVDKLVSVACEGLHGRFWYRDAAAQIDYVSRLEGWDRDVFAGVIATTSPKCSVVRNIRLSLHFMRFQDIRVVPLKDVRTSVLRFLCGKGISGPKTSAFYNNLSGCPNSVALDVWMSYALGVDQTDFRRADNRSKAISRIVGVARRLGVTPAEAQAAVWTGYRARSGYSQSPFSVAKEYFSACDNGWVVKGCSVPAE